MALSAAGVGLFSTLGPDAGRYLSAAYLVVLGVGFGLWMQVFTLTVQNTAPAGDMGASMSTLSFARQVGGALGAAAFGAIFASQLASELASRLPPRAAGRLLPDGDSVAPETVRGLPEAVRDGVVAGYAAALSTVFLVAAAVLAVGLVVALFMKEVPSGGPSGPRAGTAPDGSP